MKLVGSIIMDGEKGRCIVMNCILQLNNKPQFDVRRKLLGRKHNSADLESHSQWLHGYVRIDV